MTLPVGVTTRTLSIGREFDGNGTYATLHISVLPDFGGAQRILWTATGETFAAKAFSPPTQTDPDGDPVETFDLPIVDEAGWVDMATGEAITDWQYAVTVTVTFIDTVNGVATRTKMKPYTKYVSPLSTDSSPIDMDRLPYGTAASPTLAAGSYVTSVAGLPGAAVSAADLVTALGSLVEVGRQGNKIPAAHLSLHPPNRLPSSIFDGNSHPLSAYYSTLAAAQVLYPHATALSDETDWAALQLAANVVASKPRAWHQGDWEQYGTASVEIPVGASLKINRPVLKPQDSNKNYSIGSATTQGCRLQYTGTDGGRMFDWSSDSVGSILDVKNMVLDGAGVRLAGPLRGDIRVGNGVLVMYAPHPAVTIVDGSGVGVVGIQVEKLYTLGCAGSVWATSSTATITTVRDSRFLNSTDVTLKVSTTDFYAQNVDFTGVDATKGAAGTCPYVQVTATPNAVSNVELRDVRFGSEVYTSTDGTTTFNWAPPKEYVVLGELSGVNTDQIGTVTLRKCNFRTITPSSTIGRAAILMNARVGVLDIDECEFEGFKDCLVDEAYLATQGVGASKVGGRWGLRNKVFSQHFAPIFSAGGAGFVTQGDQPSTLDRTARNLTGDPVNLFASTVLSTWTTSSVTVGGPSAGGPDDTTYYTLTKTGTGGSVRSTFAVTAGRRYVTGIRVRRNTIRTMNLRLQIGSLIVGDARPIRVDDDEWVTFTLVLPKAPSTGTATLFVYPDKEEELAGAGVLDACQPFAYEGYYPGTGVRTSLRMHPRRAVPSAPVTGWYVADGVNWDPLGAASGREYPVYYDGAAFRSMLAAASPDAYAVQTGGDLTLPQSDATNFTDVPGVSVTLAAGTYAVTSFLEYEATSVTVDMKVKWGTTGLSPSGSWISNGPATNASTQSPSVNQGALAWPVNDVLGTYAGKLVARPAGTLVVAVAGTFKLQVSQGAAEASDVKVRNSWVQCKKLA